MKKKEWYKLDSAAKIFPAIISSYNSTVFRLSATLKEEVIPQKLQNALNKTIDRFPMYQVKLKNGLFWNFLQKNQAKPIIRKEHYAPCRKMHKIFDKGFLFRVLYFHKRISVEFSHILTDGTGANEFLMLLLQNYFDTKTSLTSIIAPAQIPNEEEWEDSYIRHYNKELPTPRSTWGAYHLPKPLLPNNQNRIITGQLDCLALKDKAKSYKVTITEYLVSTYLATLQDLHRNNPRRVKLLPLRVMVPVNLRAIYPSKTLRNFFLTVLPGIDLRLGEFTFEEILKTVHHYMQVEVNEKYINQQIRLIVGGVTSTYVKWLPLFIKAPFEKLIYRYIATRRHSGVLTNLGLVRLPDEVNDKIEKFEFLPNPNPDTKCNIGIISYGKWTTISISSLAQYRDVEKLFFTRLRKDGLRISITTNTKD